MGTIAITTTNLHCSWNDCGRLTRARFWWLWARARPHQSPLPIQQKPGLAFNLQ